MIPMTVSFFVKRSKDRKAGLRNAFIYAGSIVFIFVVLGSALTSLLGPSVLNNMSTNMWFNLLMFVLLVVFAFSFFGFYEIQLPSSWVNKSDKMADRGGLLGTFFMAFTLVLVSFSCTGPIVGTLLVEAPIQCRSIAFGFYTTQTSHRDVWLWLRAGIAVRFVCHVPRMAQFTAQIGWLDGQCESDARYPGTRAGL